MQVLGGYGYIDEFPVERMMRDAKVTQIYEGTNQVQRIVVARRVLDELAPERVVVPSGSSVRVDYTGDQPVLAVRIQEVFGWRSAPALADGRVPLLLHLLSPARRPAAVTADLESFWATGYPQVRAELRGRYPKHAWPDDPWTAPPTSRTKPRR